MKKIKHLMIWMGLLLCLVSCKDAMETIGLGGDEIPAEGVTLNIELPNFSEKKINTRAGADESISKVTAVFYGESNTYKGMANVNIGSKNADGTYQATISNVPSGTKTVHLVTNINDLTEEEAKDLQAAYRKIDTNNPICWGSVSLETLLNGTPTVDLFRPYAKVTLKVDATVTDFPEKDAGLIINHAAAKSAIAPAGYTEPTDALAETTEFSGTDFGDGTSREVVVTETSAGVANVIIRAKYKGKEGYKVGYYKVGLYKDAKTKKDQYAFLRNHNYTITVTKVNDYGFEKLDDAVKSDPENRLEVNVVDDNPAITNMIACKDYELGVSDNLSLKATDTEARITLVTTLKSGTYNVKIKDSDTWIKRYDQEGEGITTPESGRLSSSGKKYLLKFTLVPNPDETPRTGTVTISSGDLKLDVKITQDGFDFMRDPSRQVKMLKNGCEIQPDYFAWLDKDVKGIKPEQMQNVKRNDGLHFTVGKNAYSYKIPKKTGDKLTVDNLTGDVLTDKDAHFTVSADGDYWKVTLADNRDNNYDLWKGTFTIKNKDNINITYTVYHTGIFHAITDDMAKRYELAEGGDDELKVKGMFYYGVVKVQGQTQTYIMLDRNLGATDNSPYVPDINEFQKNKGAIGGYFKISEDKNKSDVKQGNLSSTLSPEGFEIPDKSVFEDLVNAGTLKTETRKTALGESYYCTFMNTTSSELKTIYLPYGGYLEGESHKYPMHVVFWTKTLVSGTQGFSVKSPEYGFWYNYFDIYNSKKGISNVRFVSGSNGNNTGRYKAMPLRLISKTVLSNPTL
ncbi:BACON domain-containing protein [Segatella copri]|uniref:BACON domain-containing protein n=1 Tax=Segatella copri TaxID=165179 RepID=UPI001862AF08|nr:BACON domain-containing protein [Segatella copri]MBM0155671.1 BACON domain-containing protein [Segatella copri]QNT68000.1 BACON domain-containing protein [Segatella copri]